MKYEVNEYTSIKNQIYIDGAPLSSVKENFPLQYEIHRQEFERLRRQYINKHMPLPKNRETYFISSPSPENNLEMAHTLAKRLFPADLDSDNLIFQVEEDLNLKYYDGQKIVLWSDVTAKALLKKYGTALMNIFDPYPHNGLFNANGVALNLKNQVHIINSVQPFDEFVDQLSAYFGNRDQITRRFPFCLSLAC